MIKIKYCKNGYKGINGQFWVVEDTKLHCAELCDDFVSAFRHYLWYIGVPPKYAFKNYLKGRRCPHRKWPVDKKTTRMLEKLWVSKFTRP